MKTLLVIDSSILEKIISTPLIEAFSGISSDLTTTAFVLHDMGESSRKCLKEKYVSTGKLVVKEQTADEMCALVRFYHAQYSCKHLSLADCSVWKYAIETGGIIITEEAALRAAAEESGVEVRGFPYMLSLMQNRGVSVVCLMRHGCRNTNTNQPSPSAAGGSAAHQPAVGGNNVSRPMKT